MADFIDENTLFILDSYGLIYREYFAFITRPLTNSRGENVSAVFGFFRNISHILRTYKPRYMVAAFDSRTPTFRHELYADYKATRQKTPDDLKAQFPWIEELLGVLGIPVVRCDGFEADDVVATLAAACEKEGRHCCILSADKDLMQLTSENVHILKPDRAEIWKEIDAAGVTEEWGVPPEKLLDLLSLTGDTADNVPGVKGVGPKTAVKLLDQYGSLEGIYEHAAEIKGAVGEKIRGDKDNAFFSKQLITLRYDVPCVTEPAAYSTSGLHCKALSQKMTEWELPAVAKQYALLAQVLGDGVLGVESADSSPLGERVAEDGAQSAQAGARGRLPPLEEAKPAVRNKGDYRAVTEAGELSAYIDAIFAEAREKGKKVAVALDTETDSLNTLEANLVGFSLSARAGSGIYVPLILTDSLLAGPTVPKADALSQIARLFTASDALVVMHNAKFDLEVLWSNGLGKLFGPENANASEISYDCAIFDTMIAAWLLEPDRPAKNAYSLEYLGETKLGLIGTEYGELVPKGGSFADVPLEKASDYGAEDADFTFQLYGHFTPLLEKASLNTLFYDMEMRVLPILANMETRGIHIDKASLQHYEAELTAQLSDIEKEIFALVGHEFNIASPMQLQKVLFEERGLAPGKKNKRGYSTDTAVLEELAEQDPVPQKVLEYRELSKLLSTYVQTLPALADAESRIHTSFMQTGTATGRLSSRDPNLQNIPVRNEAGRKIRSAFTATPGTVLISADYAQIELVVLAHLSGDPNLCAAFKAGNDVHRATAALIYGVSPEEVTPEQRRSAKTINFGVMYGMSAFRLARELGIPRTRAQEFIDNYFTLYAGIKRFIAETVLNAEENGYVETISARRRTISGIRSANKLEKAGAERVATNTPIQGSAADIVKKAMIDVDAALHENPTGARLLLQVHDELILECPDTPEAIEATERLLREKMEHAYTLQVPLRVSIEHGTNWGLFH
ncbi:MAG: DNA polymerase I [Treponema sp.]|nr:DNA polymerase I [Treponema sp.]